MISIALRKWLSKVNSYVMHDGQFWFTFAYSLWLIYTVSGTSLLRSIFPSVFMLGIRALVILFLLLQELSNNELNWATVIFGILLLVAAMNFFSIKSFVLVDIVLLIYCSRHVPFRRIVVITLSIIAFACLVIIICSQVGIIQDYVWSDNGRVRHGLGFLYTTYISIYLLTFSLLYGWLRDRRVTWLEICILFAINLGIYQLTDSRNSFVLLLMYLLAVSLLKIRSLRNALSHKLILIIMGCIVFPVYAVLSFALAWFYDPHISWMNSLNAVLSKRLSQTHASLLNYPPSIFGQKTNWVGNSIQTNGVRRTDAFGIIVDRNFVDNSYVNIYIVQGILALVIAVTLFSIIGLYASRKCDVMLTIALFFVASRAVLDPQLLRLDYNPFLFFAVPTLSTYWNIAAAKFSNVAIWSTVNNLRKEDVV